MKYWVCILLGIGLAVFLMGCRATMAMAPAPKQEIIFYDWEDDLPQSVIDQFTKEFNIEVIYRTYQSAEEAAESLEAGAVFDLVNIDTKRMPSLIEQNLLAELDHSALTNYKYLSPDFRDLLYDPSNRYSIPNSWGVVGILVDTSRVSTPVTRWSDLWRPEFRGRVGLFRSDQREGIGAALRSLGYSANSEDPRELQAAAQHLMALKPSVVFGDEYNPISVAPLLTDGNIDIALAYALDYRLAYSENEAIAFIFPQDGTLLWNDNYVIPANSTKRPLAEKLLNFLMRPDIAAQVINEITYAKPVEGSRELVKPEIRDDPVVYPPNSALTNAEVILPLSPDAEKAYGEIWKQFIEP